MQWNKKKNAGFSDVEPWIKVNPNYVSINAEDQQKDPNSIYHYYRKLIDLRKRCPIIIQGKYELIEETHSQIFAYTRSLNLQNLLVVCSFSEEDQDFKLPEKFCTDDKKLLISNWSVNKLEDKGSEIHLHPYEARVYLL
jgi:glycosidase